MAETLSVRPLDVRDLRLLHRVRRDGLCLYAQLEYTRGEQALQTAVLDVLTPGRATHTLVARPRHPGEVDSVRNKSTIEATEPDTAAGGIAGFQQHGLEQAGGDQRQGEQPAEKRYEQRCYRPGIRWQSGGKQIADHGNAGGKPYQRQGLFGVGRLL